MSIRQRWIVGIMAAAVVGLVVFFIWYMQSPQDVLDGTLVYRMGVNQYAG